MKWIYLLLFGVGGLSFQVSAKEIRTNAVNMFGAPKWLKRVRVDKVTDRIQMHMEWSIRRVQVKWFHNQVEFEKSHNLGPYARAVTFKKSQTIHIGPKVNEKNFDQIFSHELVHVISFQKYKEAIPQWLEEGLANYYAKKKKVNYQWLVRQPFPVDVRKMDHPYNGDVSATRYHYIASQSLAEMLAKKCDLTNLLRLSVGRNMETYIDTYCGIKDLNAAFKKWVQNNGKS